MRLLRGSKVSERRATSKNVRYLHFSRHLSLFELDQTCLFLKIACTSFCGGKRKRRTGLIRFLPLMTSDCSRPFRAKREKRLADSVVHCVSADQWQAEPGVYLCSLLPFPHAAWVRQVYWRRRTERKLAPDGVKKEKVNPTSLTWLWSVLIFVSLTEDRPHHRVTGCRGLTFIYLNTLARETVSI